MRKHRHFAVIIAMATGAGLLVQHSAVAQASIHSHPKLSSATTRRPSPTELPPIRVEATAMRPGSAPSIDPFLAPTVSVTELPAPVSSPPVTAPPVTAPPVTAPNPPPVTAAAGGPWLALRRCESSDNYADDTGNGYYGAYQFSLRTWESLGYGGLPSDASPAVQNAAAHRLQALAGWGQWPACARRLGLD